MVKKIRPKVVFSDIDGTLMDTFTRRYGRSKELVEKLKEHSIPVVLCSSKTWAEQEIIRKDLGLQSEPFIVENGGAVVIPLGYFDAEYGNQVNGYDVIELGKPSAEIRRVLQDVRKSDITFKGVSDVSVNELAEIVGLTHEEAARMSKRQYSETILEIEEDQKKLLEQALRKQGLQVIQGSRYLDVTEGNDKGKAVRILMDLYRKKMSDKPIFIGVGDSPNDVPMLKSTDIAFLVQKHDESWADTDIPGIVQVKGIGPAGWENVFTRILEIDEA